MLYKYLPELEQRLVEIVDENKYQASHKHLEPLVQVLKDEYQHTTQRLQNLLSQHKITYDLLWALFKEGCKVYSTCPGTNKPRGLIYDCGAEKETKQGVKYFELIYRHFDFDGKVFGEVSCPVAIRKFHGSVPIHTLEAFPLAFHPRREEAEQNLIRCGNKFVSIMGRHHCQYTGIAFFQDKQNIVKTHVDGRVIIDAHIFREINPSYARLQIKRASGFVDLIGEPVNEVSQRVTSIGKAPNELTREELLVCAPTFLGFSLKEKFWGERTDSATR